MSEPCPRRPPHSIGIFINDRQDACRELSEAQRACAAYGLAACDQAALDRLQRQCSAFGPLGQRKVGSDHTR
jgi:hypothetical protein